MLDDSYLDLLNHLESKILVAMGTDHWSSEMKEKIKQARSNVIDYRKSEFLNPESFYEKYQIKNRWARIP
jgi:hypothetical protein